MRIVTADKKTAVSLLIVVARDSVFFDSRTCYTLELRHFPRFFHEMSVPEGNARCKAENKHGGLELNERKRKDVQNSTDYQRV